MDSPHASEALPAVYVGDFNLGGYVRKRNGSPVVGARVVCRPWSFRPLNRKQFEALSTRTNKDGHFSFSTLPRSSKYDVQAYSRSAIARKAIWVPDSNGKPIELVVNNLSYERLVFLDTERKPISVCHYKLRLARGAGGLLASTDKSKTSWFDRQIHAELGIDLTERQNEVIHVYRSSDLGRPKGRPPSEHAHKVGQIILGPTIPIHIPGYEPNTVSLQRRPWSDWPQPQEVVLTPTKRQGELVAYRVLFPNPRWPDTWTKDTGRLDISLMITRPPPGYWELINRTKSTFRDEHGARFTLSVWDSGESFSDYLTLSYDLEDKGTHVLVKPHYPEMGFLDVIDHRQSSDQLNNLIAKSIESPGVQFHGNPVWPGYVRFGPLPMGDYQLWRYWFNEGRGVYLGEGEMLTAVKVSRTLGTYELN